MSNDSTSASDPRATPVIGPVKVPKPAELFADLLREKIFNGDFPTGQALPPERVLVEQSQLSRATVREALGVLKQQGLLVTKPGRSGGSIVSRPTIKDLVGSIDLFVQSQGWDSETRTLVETREVVEPWCAAFAADRRTEAQLEEMRRLNEALESHLDRVSPYLEASSAWHLAIADASHNPLLSALMHASRQAMITGTRASRFHDRSAREHSWQAHLAVTDAIADRDAAAAHRLMSQHVQPDADSASDLLDP